MTSKEYAKALSKILYGRECSDDQAERKLIITKSFAHYGSCDTALLEFEGSPSKMPVYITGLQGGGLIVTVNNTLLKHTKKDFVRNNEIIALVKQML